MFPDVETTTRSPLFSTGSKRVCSPASTILRETSTSQGSSRRVLLPSLGNTTDASQVCSRRPPIRDRGHRGVDIPVPEPDITVQTMEPLRFLGNPHAHCPCSLRPYPDRSRSVRPRETRPARPPNMSTKKYPGDDLFRGSITRPFIWLSTLRKEGRPSPHKTRFWLLAWLCQSGLATRGVPTKGFRVSRLFLLSQAFLRQGHTT